MSKKKHEWTRKGVTASMAVVLAFGMVPTVPGVALAGEGVSEVQATLTVGVSTEDNLANAIETAVSGTVIHLQNDIVLSEVLTVGEDKNITLDLAGHVLSVPQGDSGVSSLYAIHNYGSLVVKDSSMGLGSIRSRGVQNKGQLTLESGSIISFDSNGGGAAVWNEGNFLMTGGTLSFTGQKSGNNAGVPLNNQENATAIIAGGELLSPYTCIFSSGNLRVSDIQLWSSTDFWMTVKLFSGAAEFTNVKIDATNGGCFENAGAIAVLEDCCFKQTVEGNPQWNSVALATSNGGSTTVKSGIYSGSNAAVYVYSSGGVFDLLGGEYSSSAAALKADQSQYDSQPSVINVYGGDYSGSYLVGNKNAELVVKGGLFDSNPAEYVASGYKSSNIDADGYSVSAESPVATIGEASFASVGDAVSAAVEEARISLSSDVKEDVLVPRGKNVILDLNGHELVNAQSDTITVEHGASLRIVGNGLVDNQTHGRAALYNSGIVGLEGGTYSRTLEAGQGVDDNGGNSWYTICNHGTMDIAEGVQVKNSGGYSSMIENGYQNYVSGNERTGYVEGINSENPKLAITGGDFSGGLNSIKNDDGGYLEISGGVFSNTVQAAVLNWNVAKISGGLFQVTSEGMPCILNGTSDAGTSSIQDKGDLAISGGVFKSIGDTCLLNYFSDVVPVVTGGSFSSDPSVFVELADYLVVESNGMWSVSKKPAVNPGGGAGGGSTAPSEPEGEVTENPDGSTTTTVTEDDGTSVETTVSEDEGVTTVVEKDGDGAVTSVSATVSEEAVEAAGGKAVALPFAEPIEAAPSDEAVEIEVQAPAGAKVAVPVAKAEGADSVAPGAVLVLVDAEGNETVLPKTANDGSSLSAEIPGDCALKVVDASASFPDVASDDWYEEQGVADFISARGIMTGVEVAPGSFEFQGDEPTNRGMFVTMLNRLEMEAKASSGEGFADVPEDSWYADSSAWAVEAGIATGYLDAEGNAAFDGEGFVTREQMATFLFRYAQWLGLDTDARAEREIEGVSDFAKDAVSWAVAEGLIKGDDTTGAIRPGDGATRAEAAAVVMRMIELMA